MRRISWVRIDLVVEGHRCTVAGISHRLPVERSVPLDTALALWQSGVPTVIRRQGDSHTVVSSQPVGSG